MESIQLLTIMTPQCRIGIDSTEISRALTDIVELDEATSAIEDLKSKGRFLKLEEILKSNEDVDYKSMLVLAPVEGKEFVVAISGTIDIVKVKLEDIIPIPDYLKKKQDPIFVWGFTEQNDSSIMLVTFHYIIAKGAL
jgi:hypothetical protein